MLDPQRERLQDDLRGLLAGEVHCDTVYTQIYATDASLYQIQPVGVVFPQTTMDVVTAVRYAKKHGLSIHPRGAGSYCAGGALGNGLILDFSRSMRRILSLEKDVIKVQAGVQVARLNEFLRPSGLVFAPDPGNAAATTIGGMLAVDGYGSHWLSGGRPSDWLLGLEMVTAGGMVISWGRNENVSDIATLPDTLATKSRRGQPSIRSRSSRQELAGRNVVDMEKRRILAEMKKLLLDNEEFLRAAQSRNVIDRMGYRTNLLTDEQMDIAGLIASSEGTLGAITSVTLQLQKIPQHRMTIMLLFESMEKATRAVQYLPEFTPNSCDLMDRRHIHFASERDVRFEVLFPPKTEAVLLMDFHDGSRFSLYDQLRKVEDILVRQRDLAFQMIPAWDDQEAELFWSLANTLQPLPHGTSGTKAPVPMVEDVAIHPTRLHEFILKTQDLLRQWKITGAIFAHAAQGQVRLQPMLDQASATDRVQLLSFTGMYYHLVNDMGGTIGAEFGTGISRAAILPQWLGERYEISCQIKDIFDPTGVFQPGKLGSRTEKMVGPSLSDFIHGNSLRQARETHESDASDEKLPAHVSPGESFAASPPPAQTGVPGDEPASTAVPAEADAHATENARKDLLLQPLTEMGLEWNATKLEMTARKCNGCGDCRCVTKRRMCPMFHVLLSESASPRAKVNLMEGVLSGRLDLPELGGDDFHQIMRQCFQCHSCRIQCAANVDVPKLVRRAEEAWSRARGLNFYESTLVRIDRWAKKLRRLAPIVNFGLANPWGRWLLEKALGIARARKLPRLEKRSFLEQLAKTDDAWVLDEVATDTIHSDRDDLRDGFLPLSEIREKAVYFVDTYANYFDASLAWATKKVFDHNGIPLLVPAYQRGSGLPAIIFGRNDYAQKLVFRNAALMADYVRQGYDVILTEPAAVLAMKWEFPQMFPDNDDVQIVSRHVYDACDYLWKCHMRQKLELPRRRLAMTLGYHAPCRLLALNVGTPGANLLNLIPGMEVRMGTAGCCGMGGMFGILACNFSLSHRMGRKLHTWLREPELQAGVTECSACKIQMEHGSSKPTVHPVKVLALAYGLMPEQEAAVRIFAQDRVLT